MKITVCDFPDEASLKEVAWKNLVRFTQATSTDVVVFFCEWKVFTSETVVHRLRQWDSNDSAWSLR